MAKWKITPTWKKSIVEVQEWIKPGEPGYINHEIGWRWGEFIIETEDDNPPELEEGVDMFNCGYECNDWSTDDGCYEDTEVDVSDELLQEELEEFLEENSVYDLEEKGWVMSDSYMYINCELNIEKVED
jgi:hypothetical protein